MVEPVITTHNLTRRFGETLAVDRLNLEVYPGEVFGYLGHNGAGKTTTVRLLNGVLDPTSGSAQVLGLSPVSDGPALRRQTGVLTETPSLEERLTARENLQIYADLYGIPEEKVAGRIAEMLEFFELADRAEEKVGGYSKGMKQRLALARALLHDPQIIFLDEPTTGLDPVTTRRVHELITHLSRVEARTVFMATHNLNEAQRLCDRVAVLEHGRVIALGTPEALAHQIVHTQRLEIEVSLESLELAEQFMQSKLGLRVDHSQNGTLAVAGVHKQEIPDLVAGLVSAGVRLYRINPQEPSLEDVYFALHAQEEVK